MKRLRYLREERGITQEEMAQRVHVTKGYISHLETGKRANPSLPVMVRLAAALNVTVNDLLDQRAG